MKILLKQIALLSILGMSILFTSTASASCDLRGYAVRVGAYPSGIQFYFRTSQTASYYYRGVTEDPEVAAAMFQAIKGKTKVLVRGDIDSCPTISAGGEYFIGEISIVALGF